MINKYLSCLGVLVLACFSFYYTDKAVDIVRRNDPIMKSIVSNIDDYNIEAVSAYIDGDEIISGINGKKVNVNKSYQNMKEAGTYHESMYVFDEVIPNITINSNYDKYIVGGNSLHKQVSLVFKTYDSYYIDTVSNILFDKDTTATFFIDGSIIGDNINKVLNLASYGNEIENLGYDGSYTVSKMEWTNNLISSITNDDTKFCYTDYKNSDVLDMCSNYHMHTIKPTISITSSPLLTVKENIKNGSIISFNLNDTTLKQLPSVITYIKQKGYDIVNLSNLISENLVDEK